MSWIDTYMRKRVSPEEAVRVIASGQTVYLQADTGVPQQLVRAMTARRCEIERDLFHHRGSQFPRVDPCYQQAQLIADLVCDVLHHRLIRNVHRQKQQVVKPMPREGTDDVLVVIREHLRSDADGTGEILEHRRVPKWNCREDERICSLRHFFPQALGHDTFQPDVRVRSLRFDCSGWNEHDRVAFLRLANFLPAHEMPMNFFHMLIPGYWLTSAR